MGMGGCGAGFGDAEGTQGLWRTFEGVQRGLGGQRDNLGTHLGGIQGALGTWGVVASRVHPVDMRILYTLGRDMGHIESMLRGCPPQISPCSPYIFSFSVPAGSVYMH